MWVLQHPSLGSDLLMARQFEKQPISFCLFKHQQLICFFVEISCVQCFNSIPFGFTYVMLGWYSLASNNFQIVSETNLIERYNPLQETCKNSLYYQVCSTKPSLVNRSHESENQEEVFYQEHRFSDPYRNWAIHTFDYKSKATNPKLLITISVL